MSITTERLVLRTPTPPDSKATAPIFDDVVAAAMGWPPRAAARYPRALAWRPFARRHLLVCRRTDGRAVGLVSHGTARQAWAIGVMFGPEGRGHGFGREALAVALPWVRAAGAPKAVLETAVANTAMRRTAEAVGFVAIGTKPDRRLADGSRIPAVCYVREW